MINETETTAKVECYVMYRDGHGRILWRVKVHPMETKKALEKRLHRFAPDAKFIDYYFGSLTDWEAEKVIQDGRFPDAPAS